MSDLKKLLENNRNWSASIKEKDPNFFPSLSKQQGPNYLWIGCSDSRVPANDIVGLLPGELFVHRNVANVVVHTDLNCLSVIQYAVDVLKVEHIIVCGHYGCGGVHAATKGKELGLIDNWLRHVSDVKNKHSKYLEQLDNDADLINHMCELNVIEQVVNVCKTSLVRDAWSRNQKLSVHGWVYSLEDGLLKDLGITVSEMEKLKTSYDNAIRNINPKYFAHREI